MSSCNDNRVNIAMESYGCIRGYYVYQHTWTLTLGEELQCLREISNDKDPFTVAVMQQRSTYLGEYWLPVCFFFIEKGVFIVLSQR